MYKLNTVRQTAFKIYRDSPPIPDLINNPTVVKIAKKHNKSSAQVLLKYLTQLGLPVIPKSANPERIRNNFQVLSLSISVDFPITIINDYILKRNYNKVERVL